MKAILYSLFISLMTIYAYGQPTNSTCSSALQVCADSSVIIPIIPSNVQAPAGNDYGCLFNLNNILWYYFEVDQGGDIHMELNAGVDLDFVMWGPFSDFTAAQNACGSLGLAPNPLGTTDCGFLGGTTEHPDIVGAVSGDVYVMLVSNPTAATTSASLTQVAGLGSLVCIPSTNFAGTHFINGEAFYDYNQNGIREANEQGLPNI